MTDQENDDTRAIGDVVCFGVRGDLIVLLWRGALCWQFRVFRLPDMATDLMYNQWGATPASITVGVLSAIVDNIPVMFVVLTMQPDMETSKWLLVTLDEKSCRLYPSGHFPAGEVKPTNVKVSHDSCVLPDATMRIS